MASKVDTLESIVDSIGLVQTLELLGEICAAKQEHIATNWQDHVTARPWGTACYRIDQAAATLDRKYPGVFADLGNGGR